MVVDSIENPVDEGEGGENPKGIRMHSSVPAHAWCKCCLLQQYL